MYIDEQVKGRIIFTNGTEYPFTTEDIIDDDVSILQQATADNAFSIGGVYSSTLNMTIRINDENLNSFNIIGSKVILYSKYGSEQDYIIRGVFWVTSADCYRNIYTLSCSDALIWFDNAIYDDSNQNSTAEVLYKGFVSARYSLKGCLEIVCNIVNDNLKDRNVGTIYPNRSNFVWNHVSPYYSGYACGNYCVTPECANSLETSSARDYLSYIAQIGAGFIECRYDNSGNTYVTIAPFEDNWASVTTLSFENCEDDSVQLADFSIKCIRGYVEVYSGATGSWKTKSTINYQSNCYYTLDLTGNPLVDGNWAYTERSSDGDHNCMALLESLCELLGSSYSFDKGDGNGMRNYSVEVRPFKLTYHSEERFHLGQSVLVPNSTGKSHSKSVITKIQWNFRGGYNLECSGSDNRALFDSARRTPSRKAKEEAISKANYLANELNKNIEQQYADLSDSLTSQWNTLQSQIGDLNSATGGTQGDLISQWNTIQSQIGDLNTSINNLKQDLRNQGLVIS
jgi:hypothetical protein